MTQSNPKQIQDEIDRTRGDLSSNVNALADKVSPNRIVGRRVRRTRAAVTSVKERVMGASARQPTRCGRQHRPPVTLCLRRRQPPAMQCPRQRPPSPTPRRRRPQQHPASAGQSDRGRADRVRRRLARRVVDAGEQEGAAARRTGQGHGGRRSSAARRTGAAIRQGGGRQSAAAGARGARHGSLQCPGRGQHCDRRGEGCGRRRHRSREVRNPRRHRSRASTNLTMTSNVTPTRSAP